MLKTNNCFKEGMEIYITQNRQCKINDDSCQWMSSLENEVQTKEILSKLTLSNSADIWENRPMNQICE